MYFVLRAFKYFITLLIIHIAVSGDDTLKIWDIRNFKRFLNVAMNLPSYFAQ